MKPILGVFLIIGSLCGMAISLLGNTVVSSSLVIIDGMELSLGLGLFSFIALLSGIFTLFSAN